MSSQAVISDRTYAPHHTRYRILRALKLSADASTFEIESAALARIEFLEGLFHEAAELLNQGTESGRRDAVCLICGEAENL